MAKLGRRQGGALALPLLLLALVASACQPAKPPEPTAAQKAAAARAERSRRDQQRCLEDRDTLRQQLKALRSTQAELARVRGETYVPTQRPQPLDPALEARFSQADQELDSVRYQQALDSWQEAERQRYRAWRQRQSSQQLQLEERQRRQLTSLKTLNSSLFDPANPQQLSQAAVSKYSSCDPARF
jgi:hypothetical protein